MLHVLYFITRKSSLGKDRFHRYWRETHGPIVAQIPQLRRYLQSHQLKGTGVNSNYDGVAQAWVDDDAALDALRECAEYRDGALIDEPKFIDMNRVEWLVTHDRPVVDGPQRESFVKTISCVRRKAGLSVQAFRDHWREVHAPIARRLPGIRRYVQSATVDAAYTHAEPRWDGVSEIWVDDLAALQAMRESPEYAEEAMQDASLFLETNAIAVFVAQETHVIWPKEL